MIYTKGDEAFLKPEPTPSHRNKKQENLSCGGQAAGTAYQPHGGRSIRARPLLAAKAVKRPLLEFPNANTTVSGEEAQPTRIFCPQ
jgi:hypothetical protein